MTTLGVLLLTYNRWDYARATLEAAMDNLIIEDKLNVEVHIASDGDSEDYISRLCDVVEQHPNHLRWGRVTSTNSGRNGYGANYNLATQTLHQYCDYVLALEDDWEMLRPFSVMPIIEDMNALSIGCTRLGYVGYTQELRGSFVWGDHAGHWIVFDPTSPEPHVFAGHPRIEATWWSRTVGPWPEGLAPGHTEFTVAARPPARSYVGWPLSMVKPDGDLFAHIGTVRSY